MKKRTLRTSRKRLRKLVHHVSPKALRKRARIARRDKRHCRPHR